MSTGSLLKAKSFRIELIVSRSMVFLKSFLIISQIEWKFDLGLLGFVLLNSFHDAVSNSKKKKGFDFSRLHETLKAYSNNRIRPKEK